ncbi:ATP-grasp domain-containing protein [Streptomyces ficellus]|uniref:ATP-grasp domain-containing protein n=1 Tax=Streptomyces ficellus TaxID=1977088 RepID=A0A6I6FGY4_9ACTN|nr:ATP-grasp domain-containing protein [Streptomyces ficellus]QGV80447.1 ATP-grasp domain-containing protein [Streptomyces ficellus]
MADLDPARASDHYLMFAIGPRLDYAARLRELDESARISVICRPQHLARITESGHYRRVLAVRQDAPVDEVVALARTVHALEPVTRITTFWEHDQDRAAAVGAALGIATHSPATVRLVQDKHAMRERLRETGVEDTAAGRAYDEADLLAFGEKAGYPFIVKPTAGTASFGVTLVHSPAEAAAAYRTAAGDFPGIARLGVLAEQYHEGPQYSVEAFSEAAEHVVVAVTRKYSDPKNMVELGHVLPAPLDADAQEAIGGHVRRVLDALGVEFGPTHTEVVLTADGPRVIETHLRVGGDEIFNLVKDAVGVDMIDFQARQAYGDKVLPDIRAILEADREPRCEAIWYTAPEATGTFVGLGDGTDAADLDPGVTLLLEPGEELTGDGSFARVARARASAPDAAEALALAQASVNGLSFLFRVTSPEQHTV